MITPWLVFMTAWLLFALGLTTLDADLLKERARPGPGASEFIMARAARPLYVFQLVAGGLHLSQANGHWLAIPWHWFGVGLSIVGMIIVAWSMKINFFFSSVVRVQTDRNHQVIDSGPYARVRHPGYTGLLLLVIGTGLALDSLPACLLALPWLGLTLRRIRIEEKRLNDGLEGYTGYLARVRWRLVPGLW